MEMKRSFGERILGDLCAPNKNYREVSKKERCVFSAWSWVPGANLLQVFDGGFRSLNHLDMISKTNAGFVMRSFGYIGKLALTNFVLPLYLSLSNGDVRTQQQYGGLGPNYGEVESYKR